MVFSKTTATIRFIALYHETLDLHVKQKSVYVLGVGTGRSVQRSGKKLRQWRRVEVGSEHVQAAGDQSFCFKFTTGLFWFLRV